MKEPDREDLFYVYAVCTETVYNRIFGLLPIWPYSWRRRVARRISDYLNVREVPAPPRAEEGGFAMADPTPTQPPLLKPCPHCGAQYDVSHRTSGDTVLCPSCDKWFTVLFRPGGVVYTTPALPPVGN